MLERLSLGPVLEINVRNSFSHAAWPGFAGRVVVFVKPEAAVEIDV
jgi:hypothetical protein